MSLRNGNRSRSHRIRRARIARRAKANQLRKAAAGPGVAKK